MNTGLIEVLKIAVNISTPLGLLGFVTALIAFYLYRRLNYQERPRNDKDKDSELKRLKFVIISFSVVFVICFLVASVCFVLIEVFPRKTSPPPLPSGNYPCSIFRRYSTRATESFCKAKENISCNGKRFNMSDLVEVSCENGMVAMTVKHQPEIKCSQGKLEGWMAPTIEELCGNIKQIKFSATQ